MCSFIILLRIDIKQIQMYFTVMLLLMSCQVLLSHIESLYIY